MKTISIEELINGVATFNADPYCIENEELAQEVLDQIKNYGCHLIEDEDELEDAIAKLDLSEGAWEIYRAGECLFATPAEDESSLNVDVCPSDSSIIAVDDGEMCAQFSLFEEQKLTDNEIKKACLESVRKHGFSPAELGKAMKAYEIDCTVDVYHL
ncbi:MAG: hypothetical protein ACI3YI_08035 [Bacteroidaceae bacterium]